MQRSIGTEIPNMYMCFGLDECLHSESVSTAGSEMQRSAEPGVRSVEMSLAVDEDLCKLAVSCHTSDMQ